ncbi:MAG: hypothetical protein LBK29_02610 [Oscillospiraceae bacterium]|jgi:tRNA modification GTPase|nr:hypothetical protein [Oscillospiraceae bacterium]
MAKTSEIILLVLDSSKEISKEEIELLNLFKKNKVLIILNKSDLKKTICIDEIKKYSYEIVKISAKTGSGIENLKEKIYKLVSFAPSDTESLIMINERHLDILNRSLKLSADAEKLLKNEPLDVKSEIITNILEILTEFTGENINEEVVNMIFSKFCVGK